MSVKIGTKRIYQHQILQPDTNEIEFCWPIFACDNEEVAAIKSRSGKKVITVSPVIRWEVHRDRYKAVYTR
jgi:hypothetical protein